MSNTNTASKKNLAQTAAFANLLSGACASPLVYKTVNLSGSYQPVVTLTNAIEFLSEIGAQPVAFDLALAWFSIVGREIPEVLASIESDSELATAFVDELTLDLESIIEEELYSIDFHVSPHMLRRTYITNLIYAGVDPKTVQYLAGHENSKTTMDIYCKLKYNKPSDLRPVVNNAFSSRISS